MHRTVVNSMVLFMYLLTFGVFYPPTPVCAGKDDTCASCTKMRPAETSGHSCHPLGGANASHSAVRECCGQPNACCGNGACDGETFGAVCRCALQTQADSDHISEPSVHADRTNKYFAMVNADGFVFTAITPDRAPELRVSPLGRALLHRCLVLII